MKKTFCKIIKKITFGKVSIACFDDNRIRLNSIYCCESFAGEKALMSALKIKTSVVHIKKQLF